METKREDKNPDQDCKKITTGEPFYDKVVNKAQLEVFFSYFVLWMACLVVIDFVVKCKLSESEQLF